MPLSLLIMRACGRLLNWVISVTCQVTKASAEAFQQLQGEVRGAAVAEGARAAVSEGALEGTKEAKVAADKAKGAAWAAAAAAEAAAAAVAEREAAMVDARKEAEEAPIGFPSIRRGSRMALAAVLEASWRSFGPS